MIACDHSAVFFIDIFLAYAAIPFACQGDAMPQPLRPGIDSYTLHYYPGLIKDRPKHAVGIALVASEWAALEAQLIAIFTFSLFAFSERGGHEATNIAAAAWDAMESLKGRLDFIETVAKGKIPEDLFKQFIEDVKPEVRRRAAERNRVVHGHWNIAKEYPDDLILMSDRGEPPMRYSLKDFDEIAARINATSNMAATFWFRVKERLYPELDHWPLKSQPPERP
jgi:hypothetical protein